MGCNRALSMLHVVPYYVHASINKAVSLSLKEIAKADFVHLPGPLPAEPCCPYQCRLLPVVAIQPTDPQVDSLVTYVYSITVQ